MTRATIQDWTDTDVVLSNRKQRAVKYRVYKDSDKHLLEMHDSNHQPIHTLELPDGMKLDRTSYEVLLRYVLLDVIAA